MKFDFIISHLQLLQTLARPFSGDESWIRNKTTLTVNSPDRSYCHQNQTLGVKYPPIWSNPIKHVREIGLEFMEHYNYNSVKWCGSWVQMENVNCLPIMSFISRLDPTYPGSSSTTCLILGSFTYKFLTVLSVSSHFVSIAKFLYPSRSNPWGPHPLRVFPFHQTALGMEPTGIHWPRGKSHMCQALGVGRL